MVRSVRSLLLVGLALLCTAQSPVSNVERPPPLASQPDCTLWTGTSAGNDPSVRLELRLCAREGGVAGHMQWSSLQSGWSLREVEGSWTDEGRALSLRDVRIAEERPEPGWRFCVVDRWSLVRGGADTLEGTYRSDTCDDTARVRLTEQHGDAGGPPSPSSALPAAETPEVPGPPPTGVPMCGGCTTTTPLSGVVVVVMGLGLATRRRR